jgi:hypothetical protein
MIKQYRYSNLFPEEREKVESAWIKSDMKLPMTKFWEVNRKKKFKKINEALKLRLKRFDIEID